MFEKHKSARKRVQILEGYAVTPKAARLVTLRCDKARSRGAILDEREHAVGRAALLAAGMQAAARRGERRVRTGDIKTGWANIRVLECPVEICVRRTAVLRVDELKQTLPQFEGVLDKLLSDKG